MNNFSNIGAVYEAMRRAMVNLLPPPDMLPSEWAEKNIVIPLGNTIPGPISFDNAPYQRGMIDAIKEGNEVVFAGGLMGKIKKLQGEYAVVALNTTQEVMVQRASIISVLPVGTIDSLK